jgi:hypothetical protein
MTAAKRGAGNPNWLGTEASYKAIHIWLNRNHPRTGVCDKCFARGKTDYAKIGEAYTRNRDDYRELCRRCHMAFDSELRSRNEKGQWQKAC